MVFAALLVPLATVLERPRLRQGGWGNWSIVAVLTVTVACSKFSAFAVLGGGVVLLALCDVITRNRPRRPVLAALALMGTVFILVRVYLFHGRSHGLRLEPPSVTSRSSAISRFGIATETGLDQTDGLMAIVAACVCTSIFVFSLVASKMLASGLVRERLLPRDPLVVVLAGAVVSGLMGALVFGHAGVSQLYFSRAVYPYMWVLAVSGAGLLIVTRAGSVVFVLALALGFGAFHLARFLTPDGASPEAPYGGALDSLLGVSTPYLLLALLPLSCFLARPLLRRFRTGISCWTLAAMFLAGYALTGVPDHIGTTAKDFLAPEHGPVSMSQVAIPEGAFPAARRLRRLSSPDDLVATNAHCRV
ncbi:hypothetical protein, partial [Planomonospora algeriensis]